MDNLDFRFEVTIDGFDFYSAASPEVEEDMDVQEVSSSASTLEMQEPLKDKCEKLKPITETNMEQKLKKRSLAQDENHFAKSSDSSNSLKHSECTSTSVDSSIGLDKENKNEHETGSSVGGKTQNNSSAEHERNLSFSVLKEDSTSSDKNVTPVNTEDSNSKSESRAPITNIRSLPDSKDCSTSTDNAICQSERVSDVVQSNTNKDYDTQFTCVKEHDGNQDEQSCAKQNDQACGLENFEPFTSDFDTPSIIVVNNCVNKTFSCETDDSDTDTNIGIPPCQADNEAVDSVICVSSESVSGAKKVQERGKSRQKEGPKNLQPASSQTNTPAISREKHYIWQVFIDEDNLEDTVNITLEQAQLLYNKLSFIQNNIRYFNSNANAFNTKDLRLHKRQWINDVKEVVGNFHLQLRNIELKCLSSYTTLSNEVVVLSSDED